MRNILHFIPWAFRYVFSGVIQFVKTLHFNYLKQWQCDIVGGLLVTLMINLIIVLIMAVLHGMTKGTLIASWTFLIIITFEILYFIVVIVSYLWSKYREEQQRIIDALKQ